MISERWAEWGQAGLEEMMKTKGTLIIGPVVSTVSAVLMAMSGGSVLAVIVLFLVSGPLASLLFAFFLHLGTPLGVTDHRSNKPFFNGKRDAAQATSENVKRSL
ncbi:hypothetical protein [Aestuariicoccus sp. MJ-SS9]|uniref:hypothetical protein n=1 Tax=Aestuariicoccus sp. MJ-SS9 TaxID=3079855 RepID=UPI00290E4E92|nr:hypothetical protein [Aestuariicoccus sp. MJ-SS9]MDU8913847.1 hypothetical protein [Aestuariicoccus sp. MJ-SS9]